MNILGEMTVATNEGIPYARDKLRLALIHADIRPVYAAQVAAYIFQQVRNKYPATIQLALSDNKREFHVLPIELSGRYQNISLKQVLTSEKIQLVIEALNKLTRDELLNDLERQVEDRTAELSFERERSEKLLNNMLPAAIAARIKDGETIADEHNATVLFADIQGFTALARDRNPGDIVSILDQIFSKFDDIADKHGLEKIKTIGDSYMAAAGLTVLNYDHVDRTVLMGLEMAALMPRLSEQLKLDIGVRIGIHTGPLVAGVIGTKKYTYDIWGDTVNVASRMESHGVPGHVQISDDVRLILGDRFKLEERGTIKIKNRGEMCTWLVKDIAVL